MRRYQHMLRRARGGRFPGRVLCVDAASEGVHHRGHSQTIREYLTGWASVLLTLRRGSYHHTAEVVGTTADAWWSYLESLCHDGRPLWVLSAYCGRVWGLLDLWGAVDDGRLRLHREDRGRPTMGRDALLLVQRDGNGGHTPGGTPNVPPVCGQGARHGAVIAGDPPNILWGWVRQSRLDWVDIRNYGIAPDGATAPGVPLARWLAATQEDLSGAIRSYSLGSLQHTAGSQAMHGFRAGHYHGGIWCHNEQRVLERESGAICGGRCEAYRLGTVPGNAWHVDYRSLYPSVCVLSDLPVRYTGRGDCASRPIRPDRDFLSHSIARVTISTREPDYPYRSDGIVIWPVGTFSTTLCGPELVDAYDHGRIVEIHWAQEYHCEPALRDFAMALGAMREWGEESEHKEIANFAKLVSVCLPGKFGQRQDCWQYRPGVHADSPYGEWIGGGEDGRPARYRAIASRVFQRVQGDWTPDAVPAIAAWITSAGRMRLLEAIRAAGREHVWYVDTDALIVDDEGYERLCAAGLVRERTLGYLSVKGRHNNLTINGIKWYTADGRTVCAGRAVERSMRSGEPGKVWIQRGPQEYIRAGRRPQVVSELVPYQRSAEYRHGRVMPDGTVLPIELG